MSWFGVGGVSGGGGCLALPGGAMNGAGGFGCECRGMVVSSIADGGMLQSVLPCDLGGSTW